jgi:hypothetical protein
MICEPKTIWRKKFSMVLGSPTDAKLQVKNESRFSTEKNTLFYSEFNGDSEYIILFEKYFG